MEDQHRDAIPAEAPLALFGEWFALAREKEINDPEAVALATATPGAAPSVRMVLMKDWGPDGFVFYTNGHSRKGGELHANPQAAMLFHWKSLRRQIRVRGLTSREEGPEGDAYFASRSLKSRLGAWASHQSEPLASRLGLMAEVARVTATQGPSPSRPPFWGGFRIRPLEIEFWADGAFRLHDRFRWRRGSALQDWTIERLNP